MQAETNRYPTQATAGYANAQNSALGTPQAISQTASAQATLDSNISALHNAVAVLEERLQPVLGSSPPEPGNKSAGQIRPVASTVSQRIHESSETLCVAINRISALTSRLEI